MLGLIEHDEATDGTVFRDVIMLALLGFVTIVILLLPHLNPPTKENAAADPPGNVVVEVRWPDELNADVDLWAEAPGDVPVGYSNKGGQVFNLLRDDLGHLRDQSNLNYEMAFSRGIPSGEYTINLHLYRNNSESKVIPAQVAVGIKQNSYSSMSYIVRKNVTLENLGQELTVIRFSLDETGNLIRDSLHDLPRLLRSVAQKPRTD